MSRKRSSDMYTRPEMILADVIRHEATGGDDGRIFHRASVLAVDVEGGKLQNPSGNGSFSVTTPDGTKSYAATVGPSNPCGSIKARILTNALDRLRDDSETRIFWPMIPHDQIGLPVSAGEHVYVLFEGEGFENGLWVARVAGQESANSFRGSNSYTAPSAKKSAMDSFEKNDPLYQLTDSHAGEAPSNGAMSVFEDD